MVYFLLMLFSGFVFGGIISGNIGGAIIGIIGCIICIVVGIASAYKKQKTPEKNCRCYGSVSSRRSCKRNNLFGNAI